MSVLDLFRPKWKRSNWVVRQAAIEKRTDWSPREEIGKNDQHEEVRRAAKKTKAYHNQKWNLTLDYPDSWEILWENEPDGGWEIIVGIAGVQLSTGRPAVTVRILPHAVISAAPANVEVWAAGGPGTPVKLPGTPEEYNTQCIQELESVLPGFRLISGETGTVAGMRAGTLLYSYKGQTGTIREKQINLFGASVTYRLLCEAPEAQSTLVEEYFDRVAAEFKPSAD